MDFSMISSRKVDELKDFLKARGLRISGRKEELVSRVFCAVENNVPVLKSVIEIENDLSKEYQNKLINQVRAAVVSKLVKTRLYMTRSSSDFLLHV